VAILYRSGDQLLLYRWNRQPYRGQVSLPFGRLHEGWEIEAMAAEQLHYKAGLPVDSWGHLGTVNLRVYAAAELVRHNLVIICEATGPGGILAADGLTGQPFWGSLRSVKSEELVPGFGEIIRLALSQSAPFFREINIQQ
jgi:hypothetical protein